MTYERRLKGTTRWRRIPESEAKSLTGDRFSTLATGLTVDTPFALVRRREEQQALPGMQGKPPGAYSGD